MTGACPDEHSFALRQVDQARADFAILEDELEAIHAWLARLPTAADLWRATPLIAFIAAVCFGVEKSPR
jgi:hypothetical protein